MIATQTDRQKLVDLTFKVLEATKDGSRLEKKTRVGLNMTLSQCMEMPDDLVHQGIEAMEESLQRLGKKVE